MNIHTIGFTQKTAKVFFESIKDNNIEILLDVRLNNRSQLAGFTKGVDLEYFLEEICRCKYEHRIEYAPTKEILDAYRKKEITWDRYTEKYIALLEHRSDYQDFSAKYGHYENICLLCSELTAEYCHRRLLAERIAMIDPLIMINHI